MEKKRVVVDYRNITDDIIELLTEKYPYGYEDDIIKFKNAKGETVSAVPCETEDTKYLIKVGAELEKKVDAYLEDNEEDDDISEDLDLDGVSENDID